MVSRKLAKEAYLKFYNQKFFPDTPVLDNMIHETLDKAIRFAAQEHSDLESWFDQNPVIKSVNEDYFKSLKKTLEG